MCRPGLLRRPHAKTHKCPEIARRQVAAGAQGDRGGDRPRGRGDGRGRDPGVLLTSPIVEPGKIARMVGAGQRAR